MHRGPKGWWCGLRSGGARSRDQGPGTSAVPGRGLEPLPPGQRALCGTEASVTGAPPPGLVFVSSGVRRAPFLCHADGLEPSSHRGWPWHLGESQRSHSPLRVPSTPVATRSTQVLTRASALSAEAAGIMPRPNALLLGGVPSAPTFSLHLSLTTGQFLSTDHGPEAAACTTAQPDPAADPCAHSYGILGDSAERGPVGVPVRRPENSSSTGRRRDSCARAPGA